MRFILSDETAARTQFQASIVDAVRSSLPPSRPGERYRTMNTKPATNWAVPPNTPAAVPQKQPEVPSSGSDGLPPSGNLGDQETPPIRILSIDQVEAKVGLHRATIYRLVAQDLFPKQVRLSSNRVGWIESEVEAWLRNRANDRKER